MTLENLQQALSENNEELIKRLSHANQDVLDKFSLSDTGTLLYNDKPIEGSDDGTNSKCEVCQISDINVKRIINNIYAKIDILFGFHIDDAESLGPEIPDDFEYNFITSENEVIVLSDGRIFNTR